MSLALVANFIAAGVPVLHAWAHQHHSLFHHEDAGHPVEAVVPDGEHPHEDVHPLALHDDCLLAQRDAQHLALALPAPGVELPILLTEEASAHHPVSPVASRAPPSAARARAPPFA